MATKLVKQDIVVWVKASDELPDSDELMHVKIDGRKRIGNFFDGNNGEVKFYVNMGSGYDLGKEEFINLEWLKPVKDVYVLTEAEIKEIAECAFNSAIQIEGSEGFNSWWEDELKIQSIINGK